MRLRFRPFLLIIAVLVVLNACSTTTPWPSEDAHPEHDLPGQADTDVEDQPYDSPSDLSLAEVYELSSSVTSYQPDQVLDMLRSLESVPSGQLSTMIDSQLYDPEFTEWLELSLQVRTLLINGSPVEAAAHNWANYHYGHVITRANFPDLVSRYGSYFPTPSQVAILLPTDGGLAAASKAIRDGILSAFLEQPGESSIRFYSSGQDDESAVAAYLQAREDGATQIVGPLRAESTRALASLDNKDVPILLLNKPASNGETDSDQATIVSSLSLSQTDEAAAIAGNALALKYERAIVIVPSSGWGKRIETAFTSVFEEGNGHIIATAHFDPASSDRSAMLTQLLKIDESKQREAALQARLGIPLVFESIRRDDFDFIFMAADPAQGRELKPLLRFHDAGDIPVYAMSRIFSGRRERGSDRDLNGIVFAATPWQLQTGSEDTPELESIRGGALGNLYALGQDAWRLLPWLPLMQKDPDLWFPGNIGSLRLQENGHLYRKPAWAQFSAGRPIEYQWLNNH
jgi:outer membrane PBP1 activator LpoA protein